MTCSWWGVHQYHTLIKSLVVFEFATSISELKDHEFTNTYCLENLCPYYNHTETNIIIGSYFIKKKMP